MKEGILFIDSREPKNYKDGVFEYFLEETDIQCKIIKLDFGDYQFNKIVIERKDITDFSSSIKSDRLLNQEFKLLKQKSFENTHPYLILQGNYEILINEYRRITGIKLISQNRFYNTITSLEEKGISTLRTDTRGIEEFCILLNSLINNFNNSRPVIINPIVKESSYDWTVRALYQIECIGIKTAKLIQEKYSIKDIITLPKKEVYEGLQQIEGIGPSTAKKIINTIN